MISHPKKSDNDTDSTGESAGGDVRKIMHDVARPIQPKSKHTLLCFDWPI